MSFDVNNYVFESKLPNKPECPTAPWVQDGEPFDIDEVEEYNQACEVYDRKMEEYDDKEEAFTVEYHKILTKFWTDAEAELNIPELNSSCKRLLLRRLSMELALKDDKLFNDMGTIDKLKVYTPDQFALIFAMFSKLSKLIR